MEKKPRAKIPQKRAAHHRGATPTSDAKARTPKTSQTKGYQPQARRQEQLTVDPFSEIDRRQQPQQEQSGTSQQNYTPMEEGEIGSETDQDTSVLEVPVMNWAKYVGVKSVQYIKMGHATRVNAEEPNNFDLGNAVRETEKYYSTDLQLLMTQTKNDPHLLKTLVGLEVQQQSNIPEEDINEIRSGRLRRPYHCAEKPADHCDHPVTRKPSRHQQNVYSGNTLLVAEDYGRHQKQLRRIHPM